MKRLKSKKFRIAAVCVLLAAGLVLGLVLGLRPSADTENPSVTVRMAESAVVGQPLEVKFTAADNVGVTRVAVKITDEDGNDVTATVFDAEQNIFTPPSAGKYLITVEAYDAAGNKGSNTHTVQAGTVDSVRDEENPVVTFDMAETAEAEQPIEVKYTATDNVGVVRVDIAITDEDGNDVTASVYDAENKIFTPLGGGKYLIKAEAYDQAGNKGSNTHTVTVTEKPEPPVDPPEEKPEEPPAPGKYVLPANPNYGSGVAVHDPSAFYDEATGKYYAFGSHFAVASSPDLIHWQQVASDGQAEKIYGTANFRSILTKANEIVGGSENTWAPDVQKIGNKYYMYYSLTSGFGSNKSVIGRVSSDSVTGPYANEEIIVWSENGSSNPNCIDPELFYDKEGGLWMVYGSFFAGIYIKELDPNTGLPLQNGVHDYGKLLWKGASTGAEGPFVFYNEQTDYYYLMASDGSLFKDYNMRVARSKNPDGPYTDITGKNVAENYGGGNKIAGNYKFAEDHAGYAAMGHNSVVKADGKYFVVYHTRYMDEAGTGVGTAHNVQVNQLFFNADGWPVMSPNRYAGESLGKVTESDLAGRYDIIVHTEGNSEAFASSARYTLSAGGAVLKRSQNVGSWNITGDCGIEITLDGATYKGVIAPAWSTYGGAMLCFTAVSDGGRSLWANHAVTDSDIAVSGVNVLKTVYGDASNTKTEAFDPAAKGLAVSFRLESAAGDWNSATVTTGSAERTGIYTVHLPNLEAYYSTGDMKGMNAYPNGTWENGGSPSSFTGGACYVTVSFNTDGSVDYYKNGVRVAYYQTTSGMVAGDIWVTTTVKDYVNRLFGEIKAVGLTFGAGITARDLIISDAVNSSQAQALYRAY